MDWDHPDSIISISNGHCQWASHRILFHSQTTTQYIHVLIQHPVHSVHNYPHFTTHIYSKYEFPFSWSFPHPVLFHNILVSFRLELAGYGPAPVKWMQNTQFKVRPTRKLYMSMILVNWLELKVWGMDPPMISESRLKSHSRNRGSINWSELT